jgi:hypothetical protein
MRVALLTLEALASAAPVRRFIAQNPDRIAMVALSDPYRPQAGGFAGQAIKLIRRSGPRIIPYLLANFVLPHLGRLFVHNPQDPGQKLIAALCRDLNIPLSTESDMNGAGFHARLRASGADVLVTFHCDQILTAETINSLDHGGINVHCGLLPDHRGPVPTIHALLESPPRFGITVHRLVPKIDAGGILAQAPIALPEGTSALTAARLLHEAALPLLDELLADAAPWRETLVPQKPYCPFPTMAQMSELARLGHCAADWADVIQALKTPV